MTNLNLQTISDVAIADIPRDVFEKVSIEYFLSLRILPVAWAGQKLKVAVADPYAFYPLDNLSRALQAPLELALMDGRGIERILRKLMEQGLEGPRGVLEEFRLGDPLDGGSRVAYQGEDLIHETSDAPAVRMVNSILREAVGAHATDVHFHPGPSGMCVLYRRDGMLHEVHRLPAGLAQGVLARLKVMAKLDLAQRQLPQDGRISLKGAEKEVDLRVSTVPTVQGERAVLRLLDRDNLLIRADALGMGAQDYQRLSSLMEKPNGMILVTGPTGSGKTTTLYSFMAQLDLSSRNAMTIEDPVEYKMEGITQIAVRPGLGLTFAKGLRAILRQDPDVILVGEIRDEETAQIAIRAALTGHLVLSTLHTTDAPGAVTRLLDIGIEPYLISSALMAVVSQRLLRKICSNCKGEGCPSCFSTGFLGRTGIFELLPITDDFRTLIHQKAPSEALRDTMNRKGIAGLEAVGRQKVELGITTERELLRVTGS